MGRAFIVQIDETFLVRKQRFCNTFLIALCLEILFGLLVVFNRTNLLLFLWRLCSTDVLTELLGRMIQPGSVLVTDGFSFYSSVLASLHLEHKIVVHYYVSVERSMLINMVSTLTKILKTDIRKKSGIHAL